MTAVPSDLAPGSALEPVRWRPPAVQVFLYSAATRNPHRIHYDAEFARAEGQAGVLVQGPLLGARLCAYVDERLRGRGRLTALSYRNERPVAVGDELVARGEVVAVAEAEAPQLELRVWHEQGDGVVVVEGSATFQLESKEV